MPAQIYLSVKNGKITEVTESQLHKNVEAFHDRHRLLRVFHVIVSPQNGGPPEVGIQVWRNKDIDRSDFRSTKPDFVASGSGETVISATDSAIGELEEILGAREVEVAPAATPWYKSPFVWFTASALAAMLAVVVFLAMQPRSNRNLSPVKGTVTLDSKPLVGAHVMLHPIHGGRPASATTDEGGKFEMSAGYRGSSGAYPGEYRITVVLGDETEEDADPMENLNDAIVQGEAKRIEDEEAIQSGKRPKPPKFKVHINYTNFAMTPLEISVPTSGPLKIELKEDGT